MWTSSVARSTSRDRWARWRWSRPQGGFFTPNCSVAPLQSRPCLGTPGTVVVVSRALAGDICTATSAPLLGIATGMLGADCAVRRSSSVCIEMGAMAMAVSGATAPAPPAGAVEGVAPTRVVVVVSCSSSLSKRLNAGLRQAATTRAWRYRCNRLWGDGCRRRVASLLSKGLRGRHILLVVSVQVGRRSRFLLLLLLLHLLLCGADVEHARLCGRSLHTEVGLHTDT